MTTCSMDGCAGPVFARGWCRRHYRRWSTLGSPDARPIRFRDLTERMEGSIARDPGGCWLWTGRTSPNGYGMVSFEGKHRLAHRVFYEVHVGPIPAGLQLDHLCRVRACVNPAHLEPVTARENTMRSDNPPSLNARKTHCKRGHEFTEENTYIIPSTGSRQCRACVHYRKAAS